MTLRRFLPLHHLLLAELVRQRFGVGNVRGVVGMGGGATRGAPRHVGVHGLHAGLQVLVGEVDEAGLRRVEGVGGVGKRHDVGFEGGGGAG